ncbi:hypothetical protein FQN50_007291 [Emmonsiellopsis sp. PD_5]|nr:hypothetical protein FQN50_007291 [Emmonsiellopsis sp. PD_5]
MFRHYNPQAEGSKFQSDPYSFDQQTLANERQGHKKKKLVETKKTPEVSHSRATLSQKKMTDIRDNISETLADESGKVPSLPHNFLTGRDDIGLSNSHVSTTANESLHGPSKEHDDDENSDGDGSLCNSLFSDDDGRNMFATDSSEDIMPVAAHEGDVVPETQISDTGGSKDLPIVLQDEEPATDKDEEWLSFDERIPLSLRDWKENPSGPTHSTSKNEPSRKRKLASEPACSDNEDRVKSLNTSRQSCSPDRGAARPRSKPTKSPCFQSAQEKCPQSPALSHCTDRSSGETQPEVVWEHGPLKDYKVVDGKPLVLVPWSETWELPDEFSREEVERVKQQYLSSLQPAKQRGRPPSCAASTLPDSGKGQLRKDTTAVQRIRAELNKRPPLEPFEHINEPLSYRKLCSFRKGIQRAESLIQDSSQSIDSPYLAPILENFTAVLEDFKGLLSHAAMLELAIAFESKKRTAPPKLGGQERNIKRQRLLQKSQVK